VSPVRYELGFYIPEDDTLHTHRRENLKSYTIRVWKMLELAAPLPLRLYLALI
jgi:hypothetical protein